MALLVDSNNLNVQADKNLLRLTAKDKKDERENSLMEQKGVDQTVYSSDKNLNDIEYSFEVGV